MERATYATRLIRPGERQPPDDLLRTTPEERLEMMWPLAVDAWAFMGNPIDESRLQRHIVHIVRGRG
jgi:hypothetical protein